MSSTKGDRKPGQHHGTSEPGTLLFHFGVFCFALPRLAFSSSALPQKLSLAAESRLGKECGQN